MRMNNHAIKLIENQQLSYKLVFSIDFIELETIKTFITTNLTNSFIKFSKFAIKISLLFIKKFDRNF